MAIEIARHVESAAPVPGTAARGKSSAAPDDNSAFGAVLASIDDAPAADASATAGNTASDTPEEPVKLDSGNNAPADVATPAAPTAAGTTPTVVDTSALLLAQSTLGAVNVVPPPVRDFSANNAAPVEAAVITGVTASVGRTADPQNAPEAPGLPTTPLVARPAAATPGMTKDTGTVETPSAALGVALLGRADGKKDGVKDPLRPAATAQDASAVGASRHAFASVAAAAAAATDASAQARVTAAAAEPAAAAPAMVTALATEMPAPWRRLERAPDGVAVHAGLASGNDTALAASPFVTAPDAAGAGAAANGAGFTERLVEQVSWWMANRSQGAELKLDLPGGAPVSVTVQVTGNEAHVAFRSDSPEARQWLGAALPQLKEMFGNEGLMLSGASVGQSGTGAEQEAARDAQRALRSNAGTGASGSAEPAAAAAVRPRTVVERALDLYV
ncbi:MAG: flagellar hook-length control protein FliK [Comamonadaceae bacterium]|nr:MAG: flagellar hook-length control protein FliK [Comamonadaceae bacterium]